IDGVCLAVTAQNRYGLSRNVFLVIALSGWVSHDGGPVVFSSPSFIFLFLPLFFASYYLIAPRARNTVILIGSILFYFMGAGHVAIVLILSVPLNQYIGKYMFRHRGTRTATLALGVGIVANLLPLLVYKY